MPKYIAKIRVPFYGEVVLLEADDFDDARKQVMQWDDWDAFLRKAEPDEGDIDLYELNEDSHA